MRGGSSKTRIETMKNTEKKQLIEKRMRGGSSKTRIETLFGRAVRGERAEV